MEDDKSDSLKKNESKINQHLEKIKSGLEITGKKVIDSSSKAVDATSKWTSDLTGKAIEKKDEIIENRQRKRDEFVESLPHRPNGWCLKIFQRNQVEHILLIFIDEVKSI